jgi:hypothetical protein
MLGEPAGIFVAIALNCVMIGLAIWLIVRDK